VAGRKIEIPSSAIHRALEHLITTYQAEAHDGESFSTWARKQSMARLAMLLGPE